MGRKKDGMNDYSTDIMINPNYSLDYVVRVIFIIKFNLLGF